MFRPERRNRRIEIRRIGDVLCGVLAIFARAARGRPTFLILISAANTCA
jgi:hypothetical protein